MPDFWLLALSAAAFLLLPYRGYSRGDRASVLKAFRKSDWRRSLLERFWLLTLSGSCILWLGITYILFFRNAGSNAVMIVAGIAAAIGLATMLMVSVMPSYIIAKASEERAERRAKRSPKP